MKKLTALAAAISLAVLSACAGPSKPLDTAKLEQSVQIVDLAYSTASAAIVVYCAAAPSASPCNNPGAMAEIAKAQAVLGVAITRAKADILAARDADALTLATRLALDALAVYAKVMATYGVNSGGG
jgi:hypothetical protein